MPRSAHPCPGCGGPTWGELCHTCRRARRTRPCAGCGEPFTHQDRRQRFCSRACLGWASSRHRECEVCGADYEYTYLKQRTCSRVCGAELRRRVYGFAGNAAPTSRKSLAKVSCLVYHRNCAECGVLFVARHKSRLTCGAVCARKRLINQVLDRHYGYKVTGMREGSLVEYLKARDRGRCGICRKPVRADSGERGPSIDHIVPRSRGGGDELENLQLAHLDCNRGKHNRGGGEQLLLVG